MHVLKNDSEKPVSEQLSALVYDLSCKAYLPSVIDTLIKEATLRDNTGRPHVLCKVIFIEAVLEIEKIFCDNETGTKFVS